MPTAWSVRPSAAIENLTATTLRNIIGELELDASLTSRDIINTKIRQILDEATDAWGIKVNRVELKKHHPAAGDPERDGEADEGRARKARRRHGGRGYQKQSAILVAEGEKESTILRAEAKKEARIREAEGEALAILRRASRPWRTVLRMLNEAAPSRSRHRAQEPGGLPEGGGRQGDE